jgi:HEAT repeat protein
VIRSLSLRSVVLFAAVVASLGLGLAILVKRQSHHGEELAWATIDRYRDHTIQYFDAVHDLVNVGPDAIPVATAALKDERSEIRWMAAMVLSRIGPKAARAIPDLIEALNDDDARVRCAAASALGQIGADARLATRSLKAALKDEDGMVRMWAAEALWRLHRQPKMVLPVLNEGLLNGPPHVRNRAAGVVRLMGHTGKDAVPALIEVLKDEDRGNRLVAVHIAVQALGDLGPHARSAAPFLVKALKEEDFVVREYAAQALESIGVCDDVVIDGLKAALKDNDSGVRIAAESALRKLHLDAAKGTAK